MGKCECVCEQSGLHGETGTKLDSATSVIAGEMKQTTAEKKKRKPKRKKREGTTRPQQSVEQGRLARKPKKTETHFSFCSTYFRQQMTKQH